MLTLKDEKIKDLKIMIKLTNEKINKVFDGIQSHKSEKIACEKQQKERLERETRNLKETKEIYQKSKENQNKITENCLKIQEIKNKKTDEFDKNLKKNKEFGLKIEEKLNGKQKKIEELEILISQISKTKSTKSYADVFECLEINEEMMDFCIENNSKIDSIDELSSFVQIMRKSLSIDKKTAKKSVMMKHSLMKTSMAKREKKLGFEPQGICCGNNDCKLF